MPLAIVEVLRDPELRILAQKYLTDNEQGESYSFLADQASNEQLYKQYVRAGSPQQVNISTALRVPMDAQARLSQWGAMDVNMEAARVEIRNLINANGMKLFAASEEYLDYLASQDETAGGRVATALKLKPANVAPMKALLKVYLNARTPLDKYAAYEALIKLAGNEIKLAAALKKGGLKALPPIKKGSPETSMKTYGGPTNLSSTWHKNATHKTKVIALLKKYNTATTRTAREKVRQEIIKYLAPHSPNSKAVTDTLLRYGGWTS
jgi:hypothetical protein